MVNYNNRRIYNPRNNRRRRIYNSQNNNRRRIINTPIPPPKSNKKIWFLIFIVVFIIVVGLAIFLFINSSSETLSEDEVSQGINFELEENKEIKFIIDGEKHTLKLNSVSANSVNLIIRSDPIQVNMEVGDKEKFDLNHDDFYDIEIRLIRINEGISKIYLEKIHENTCIEDWNCEDWSSCVDEGQTRTCTDSNSCGAVEDKPIEQQSCVVEIIDCGNIIHPETLQNSDKFDCFIDASVNCEPTDLLWHVSSIDGEDFPFKVIVTSTKKLKIEGMESNKCIYSEETINSTFEYNEELIQSLIDAGQTREEIEQQEKEGNEEIKEFWDGLETSCKFNTDGLTSMFNKWKEGNITEGASCIYVGEELNCEHLGDFKTANCKTVKN